MPKLNKNDVEFLINQGVYDEDIPQIREAALHTTYSYYQDGLFENDPRKLISINVRKVIKALGREEWLLGLSRSAFHFTTSRTTNHITIFFDSSELFRNLK